MKTCVDIITGFLNSGKTTYINELLQDKNLLEDRVVVIQCENGEIGIESAVLKDNIVFINTLEEQKDLDVKYLGDIIDKYLPDRIIIEYNGMLETEKILSLFEKRSVRKKCFIGNIICLVDVSTFEVYMNNLGNILRNQIVLADRVVLNKIANTQEENFKRIEKSIRNLNRNAELFKVPLYDEEFPKKLKIDVDTSSIDKSKFSLKISNIFISIFLMFVIAYFTFSVMRAFKVNVINIDFSEIKIFNMIFISILMQAFPFMLVGMFVSSIMHVFISNETIVKLFPKKFGLGFLTAMFGGLLFPVCECAIVPVTARLVKKGVSLPVAVTFMLSAPIINPIVITSTLYAFPEHPEITIYRIYFGLVIALAVGLILTLFPETKPSLLDEINGLTCDCVYCNLEMNGKQSIGEKIRIMFLHAGEEFFSVGKYFVLGAFLTSLIQTIVPRDIFSELWVRDGLALVVMMAIAFLFSVCSTSDAFIARSFWDRVSTGSIMGFLVFGPMMDVKNLFMLFASFRKSFVIKLVIFITIISFVLLYFLTFLLL
ncbi:permease [Clostridium sp. D2Q-14]|uniref:permease n=1 Tax=Anaeromonas gelatinilytica TaxID=2683194 RepID=UPI00193BEA64|nr:permease [Anaeromonas gelatinilytica]MBS4535253.1 permease [Anaeromonas gelatinilytica]